MEGLRRSGGGFEGGRKGGADHWSRRGRGQQSCRVRRHGVERWTTGLLAHLGRPEWTLSGGLDLRLDVGMRDGVGLRLDTGLCLWVGLLLLLQEDLVVQKLELSGVPVG